MDWSDLEEISLTPISIAVFCGVGTLRIEEKIKKLIRLGSVSEKLVRVMLGFAVVKPSLRRLRHISTEDIFCRTLSFSLHFQAVRIPFQSAQIPF